MDDHAAILVGCRDTMTPSTASGHLDIDAVVLGNAGGGRRCKVSDLDVAVTVDGPNLDAMASGGLGRLRRCGRCRRGDGLGVVATATDAATESSAIAMGRRGVIRGMCLLRGSGGRVSMTVRTRSQQASWCRLSFVGVAWSMRDLATFTVATERGGTMAKSVEGAREDLIKAHRKVQEDLPDVRAALEAVERAGVEDDLEGLLGELEKTVHKVRTGGVLGSGANEHKRARDAYFQARGTPAK
jgi:hypothetical protein